MPLMTRFDCTREGTDQAWGNDATSRITYRARSARMPRIQGQLRSKLRKVIGESEWRKNEHSDSPLPALLEMALPGSSGADYHRPPGKFEEVRHIIFRGSPAQREFLDRPSAA